MPTLTPQEKIEKKRKAKIENAVARLYSAVAHNFIFPHQESVDLEDMQKIVKELVEENSFWPQLSFNEVLTRLDIDFDEFAHKHHFYLSVRETDDSGGYDIEDHLKINPENFYAFRPLISILSGDTDIIYNEEKISLYTDWVKVLVSNGADINQTLLDSANAKIHTTLLLEFVQGVFYIYNSPNYDGVKILHQNLITELLNLGANPDINSCIKSSLNDNYFHGNLKEYIVWATKEAIDEGYSQIVFGKNGGSSSMTDFIPSILEKRKLEQGITIANSAAASPSLIKI